MKKLINIFLPTLPFSVAIVCVFGIIYLVIQQYIRLSANEIPMQYAMDAKNKLEQGIPAAIVANGTPQTNLQNSIAPFVIVCDNKGNTIASSATLNGKTPDIPSGVFAVALQQGENRRTWQPQPGIRNATVILPCTISGQQAYVVGGQSLKETEARKQFVFLQIAAGVIITLVLTGIATLIVQFTCARMNNAAYN